jgi:hypothetical protein
VRVLIDTVFGVPGGWFTFQLGLAGGADVAPAAVLGAAVLCPAG